MEMDVRSTAVAASFSTVTVVISLPPGRMLGNV
jgi:hypothetical protein